MAATSTHGSDRSPCRVRNPPSGSTTSLGIGGNTVSSAVSAPDAHLAHRVHHRGHPAGQAGQLGSGRSVPEVSTGSTLAPSRGPAARPGTPLRQTGGVDEIDRALVTALRRNGRAPFAELGRQVGLSGPSVQDRVRRLEERGVVTGFHAAVDPRAVGLGTSALVGIYSSDNAESDDVARRLREVPEVEDCWFVAGEEEFVIFVRAADTAALEHVIAQDPAAARRGPHPHHRGAVDALGAPARSAAAVRACLGWRPWARSSGTRSCASPCSSPWVRCCGSSAPAAWLWLLLTALVSLALSYVLLRLPREQAAAALDERVSGRKRSGSGPAARPGRRRRGRRGRPLTTAETGARSGAPVRGRSSGAAAAGRGSRRRRRRCR